MCKPKIPFVSIGFIWGGALSQLLEKLSRWFQGIMYPANRELVLRRVETTVSCCRAGTDFVLDEICFIRICYCGGRSRTKMSHAFGAIDSLCGLFLELVYFIGSMTSFATHSSLKAMKIDTDLICR